jgi:hypothetical protein
MGSSNTHKSGILAIDFKKQFYYPGDKVDGVVYLNMTENMQAAGLELNLQIIESVTFKDADSSIKINQEYLEESVHLSHPKMVADDYSTSIILYQNSWTLARFNNNLVVTGQYAYPFTFILPYHLPGSFEYYDADNTAFIKYSLTGKVISTEIRDNDIIGNSLLVVRQPSQEFEYPTQLNDIKEMKSFCCISQGTAALSISYPKAHFHPDETVKIICIVDNTRCSLDARSIKIQLIQRISLKDSKNNFKYLYRKVAEQVYTGVLPRGQDNTRILELPISDLTNPVLANVARCDHKHLFKDIKQIAKLQATVMSQLVNCKYYLKVKTEYYGFCVTETPGIDIPIMIYIPDVRVDLELLKPNEWDPTFMPHCSLDLPSAEQLGIINVNQDIRNN